MKEISVVHQRRGESPRRWFSDSYFDLIVWGGEGEITAFQLAYDKRRAERAISWTAHQGIGHFVVDRAADRPARHARAGVLQAATMDDQSAIVNRFRDASASIDREVSEFVVSKLEELLRETP